MKLPHIKMTIVIYFLPHDRAQMKTFKDGRIQPIAFNVYGTRINEKKNYFKLCAFFPFLTRNISSSSLSVTIL